MVVKKKNGYEYIEEGSGETLILLHGLFGQLSNYTDMVNYFCGRYKIVVPLLPIYSLPLKDTNLRTIAGFLHRFTVDMNLDRFSLVGNSMGGHIALIYSVDYPQKVERMVLTGSSGLYENSFGEGYPRKGNYEYIDRKVRITFYDPAMASRELVDECYALINDREKLFRILALAKSAIRHNMASELPGIKIPTCLIWGRNDIITPPDVAVEFSKLLPDAELFWIEKCGHAPMMEHPQEFNLLMDKWIEKRKSSC